jgi:hypothetical protein
MKDGEPCLPLGWVIVKPVEDALFVRAIGKDPAPETSDSVFIGKISPAASHENGEKPFSPKAEPPAEPVREVWEKIIKFPIPPSFLSGILSKTSD